MKNLSKLLLVLLLMGTAFIAGCDDNDVPPEFNEEEVVDLVRLTFTPTGGTPLVYEAKDADGEGPGDFEIPNIGLFANTTYTLSIEVENSAAGEDITSEIAAEGEEHMFFFAWNSGAFSNPTGDGNIDIREDGAVNYNDEDENGLPIGLSTAFTTGTVDTGEYFRILLKHQPDIKSATTTSHDGESDIDLTWNLIIQ